MEYHAIHEAARVVSRYGIFRSVPVFGGYPQMFLGTYTYGAQCTPLNH
jgi:hypothetical protein